MMWLGIVIIIIITLIIIVVVVIFVGILFFISSLFFPFTHQWRWMICLCWCFVRVSSVLKPPWQSKRRIRFEYKCKWLLLSKPPPRFGHLYSTSPTQLIKKFLWQRWKAALAALHLPSPPPSLLKANSGSVFYEGKYIRLSPRGRAWCLTSSEAQRRRRSVFGGRQQRFSTEARRKKTHHIYCWRLRKCNFCVF